MVTAMVHGVRAVQEPLEQGAAVAISLDDRIRGEIHDELAWDTRIRETDVHAEVRDAVVTLSGTVESWAVRLAAEEAACRVAGVLHIINAIAVDVPPAGRRSDADLQAAAGHALDWDVLVPSGLRAKVRDAVVLLEGTVELAAQRDDAARAVRNLRGVREVRNAIVVAPPNAAVSAQVLRSAVTLALARQADRAARGVTVVVEGGGRVTLRGVVPTAAERRTIEEAVRETEGVWEVDDLIDVERTDP